MNDEAYVDSWIQRRLSKGVGPHLIKHELSRKGIKSDLITEKLKEITPSGEYQIAERALKSRLKISYSHKKKLQQKYGLFLQRRGFSYNVICRLLNDYFPMDNNLT